MNVLVLGANGMIGSAMLRVLSENKDWLVTGVVRTEGYKKHFPEQIASQMKTGVDLTAECALIRLFAATMPDVIVNCAGLTKHVPLGNESLPAIEMNALLPNRLAQLCNLLGARLIQISTDCVFSGKIGNYSENDIADAQDIYAKSKLLGEVSGPGLITLRTSTIGHEINTKHGLLEWFLSQAKCHGFTKAVFSGLPSVIFAEIIRDVVIPDTTLTGLYHVAGPAITKSDLLKMITETYQVNIQLIPDNKFIIDRSLDASRFAKATGYHAPAWPEMIATMYNYHKKESCSHV